MYKNWVWLSLLENYKLWIGKLFVVTQSYKKTRFYLGFMFIDTCILTFYWFYSFMQLLCSEVLLIEKKNTQKSYPLSF